MWKTQNHHEKSLGNETKYPKVVRKYGTNFGNFMQNTPTNAVRKYGTGFGRLHMCKFPYKCSPEIRDWIWGTILQHFCPTKCSPEIRDCDFVGKPYTFPLQKQSGNTGLDFVGKHALFPTKAVRKYGTKFCRREKSENYENTNYNMENGQVEVSSLYHLETKEDPGSAILNPSENPVEVPRENARSTPRVRISSKVVEKSGSRQISENFATPQGVVPRFVRSEEGDTCPASFLVPWK